MLHSAGASRRPAPRILTVLGLFCGLIQACSGGAENRIASEEDGGARATGDAFVPQEVDDSGAPVTPGSDATKPGIPGPPSSPGPKDAGVAADGAVVGGPSLPCAVSTVLTTYCTNCHAATPLFGAPMSLETLADLQAPARGEPGRFVYDQVLDRIADVQRPMPPQPNPGVAEADAAVLRDWVAAGAPAGESCDAPPPASDAGMPGELPPPDPDCDYVIELRAHGLGVRGDDSGFPVPPLTDYYVNFTFQVPWTGEAQGLSFYPIIDDARVVHHWLLYTAPLGAVLDGSILPGIGMHPGEALVAGWAPGGIPSVMPENVGIELPNGPLARFILELHYHNDQGILDAVDRSGVRVCATTKVRPQKAAVHLLGTEIIAMAGAGEFHFTGICTPYVNIQGLLNRDPVHIISSAPHLHRRGTHITTKIHRGGGGIDVLLDTPFDFDNQVIYQTPNIINPGDWLETTCTYVNPGGIAGFGIRTEDEMCQNYLTAWPVGALDTGGSIIFEQHACML